MSTLSTSEAKTILRRLGWGERADSHFDEVVRNFQRGWNLGTRLEIDGDVGPNTSAALEKSDSQLDAGKSTASAHFSFTEFRCKGGAEQGCQRIWVRRVLLRSLETYRDKVGHAVTIISGCRCERHNDRVGGAQFSQHLFGVAADVPLEIKAADRANDETFSGIGRSQSTSLVRHVDRRDASAVNPTNGTLTNPTQWVYTS